MRDCPCPLCVNANNIAETNSAGQGPDLPVKDASKSSQDDRTTPAPAESDTPIVDIIAYRLPAGVKIKRIDGIAQYNDLLDCARELERHARAMAAALTHYVYVVESVNDPHSFAPKVRDAGSPAREARANWRAFCEEKLK